MGTETWLPAQVETDPIETIGCDCTLELNNKIRNKIGSDNAECDFIEIFFKHAQLSNRFLQKPKIAIVYEKQLEIYIN
jgi:hypothetical protein